MDTDAQLKAINRRMGRRLKMARQWRNLRVEDLATRSGMTASALENYERGAGRICADRLLRIALLDLPTDYFFESLKSPEGNKLVYE